MAKKQNKMFCVYVKRESFDELYIRAINKDDARILAGKLIDNGTSSVIDGDTDEFVESVESVPEKDVDNRKDLHAKENAEWLVQLESEVEE